MVQLLKRKMYTKKVFICCIILLTLNACKNKSNTGTNNKEQQMALTETDIKEIKQHLADQKRIETEESDDDAEVGANPYELKQRDLELAGKVIKEGLKNSGYKEISDEEFTKRTNEIFGLAGINGHKMVENKGFTTIYGEKEKKGVKSNDFDAWFYTKNIFLINDGHFMTIMETLKGLIKVNDDNTYKITVSPAVVHRNKYLFNDDKASFTWLANNDQIFLEQLISEYGYDKDQKINKIVLDSVYKANAKENPVKGQAIASLFFAKDANNKLIIRDGLLKYVEEVTSAKDNRFIYALGFFTDVLYDGDRAGLFDENPSKKFTALEKAKIVAYIANIENPAIDKYKTFDSAIWNNASSTLYVISVSHPEVIKLIEENNYFGLPKMKGIIEKLPEEAPPALGDPE